MLRRESHLALRAFPEEDRGLISACAVSGADTSGLSVTGHAEDHMHGWEVDLDDDSLRISIPAKNFRMISLN